jgi:hypothetical protein
MALPAQENRPLIFLLFNDAGLLSSLSGIPTFAILGNPGTVHPESYNYRRPSRGAVLNTAGAAFLDDFSQGVGMISIEGNTAAMGDLGLINFKNLELMFISYHAQRDALKAVGADPSTVHLWLVDTLNVEASDVYPMEFNLVKLRNRPLLYQYRIQLVVLSDLLTNGLTSLVSDLIPSLSTASAAAVSADLASIGLNFAGLLTSFIA